MNDELNELAKAVFMADNFNATDDVTLRDWEELVAAEGDGSYAHRIAQGLIQTGYVKREKVTEWGAGFAGSRYPDYPYNFHRTREEAQEFVDSMREVDAEMVVMTRDIDPRGSVRRLHPGLLRRVLRWPVAGRPVRPGHAARVLPVHAAQDGGRSMSWGPEMGLSAQAIAGGGRDHPHDPSDLLRCVNYCQFRGISTDSLRSRMRGRSTHWDRLLPEWDNLTALLRHEMDTRTDGTAPRTYSEMKRVLNNGTACAACDSTGRGAECVKCKGSGRRSGGRCRAEHCYRGAAFCPTCDGRGYLPAPAVKESAA